MFGTLSLDVPTCAKCNMRAMALVWFVLGSLCAGSRPTCQRTLLMLDSAQQFTQGKTGLLFLTQIIRDINVTLVEPSIHDGIVGKIGPEGPLPISTYVKDGPLQETLPCYWLIPKISSASILSPVIVHLIATLRVLIPIPILGSIFTTVRLVFFRPPHMHFIFLNHPCSIVTINVSPTIFWGSLSIILCHLPYGATLWSRVGRGGGREIRAGTLTSCSSALANPMLCAST